MASARSVHTGSEVTVPTRSRYYKVTPIFGSRILLVVRRDLSPSWDYPERLMCDTRVLDSAAEGIGAYPDTPQTDSQLQ